MMGTMSVTSPSQDVARRLTDDGYVVVTGMMTPDGVQNAHADLDRLLRATRTGRNSFEGFGTQRIYALFAKTRVFDSVATHPVLLGVLDQVLGHYQLSAPVGICIGPGERRRSCTGTTPSTRYPSRIRRWWSTPCGRWMSSLRRTGLPGSYLAATGGSLAESRGWAIR